MDRVECIVAGAGVVGLAVARALALAGREVIVVEAAGDIGTGTSSRNSEVIHAGIYYPAGSAMARLCVAGRQMLYRYCEDHGVPYRRCGKFIVATGSDESDRLAAIRARAEANGVTDLVTLSAEEAHAREPALNCTGALHSPSTGIVDSHALMLALRGDAEQARAAFAFHAPLVRARRDGDGFVVEIGGDAPMTLGCDLLINAAGLSAPEVARAIAGLPPEHIPTAYYAKGNYFACTTRVPFSRLIYPLPEPGGLGVHLTLDIGGAGRFGPDVEWVETLAYDVDPKRAERFYPAIRRYWPDLPDGALVPAYSGIRPKIVPPGAAAQDFVIQGAQSHGVPGLVSLFGIESPGLTASLAIAEDVRALTSPH
ncbi:L-2-hydroxyglutarate oxidase LhgO [Afipia felis]|uniref:L-2-hydroxyglutarate oxidase LhgO n=1 Tax=Afipia felis TaxID=1035 RepID=A0A090MHR3_AFIFE|nr:MULTISPECIES: NAD(P)/FAD-dependent oxidoreductase [Afipia]EFI52377.1 FAD dependent oxidoreductase [Afipia sp. 1NLS2]CEG07135.1 L-2-hydroxyglutarate oxidase LhgO [Afipia felis]